MAHSEIVVYDGALRCVGCGASSKETPWGRLNVFRDRSSGNVLEKKPVGNGCAECMETFAEAALPGTSTWDTEMKNDAAQATLAAHVRRRRGQPSHFDKHAATVETQYRTIWQEEYHAVDASAMKQKHGADALLRGGVQVDVVLDSQGQRREVVLCPTGAVPKVLVQTIVTHTHTEHHLRPETHLRPEQGAEFKAQMREHIRQEPLRRPMANRFSREDLDARLGGTGGGPRSGGPSGSGGGGTTTVRPAGVTAVRPAGVTAEADLASPAGVTADAVVVHEEGVSIPRTFQAGVTAPRSQPEGAEVAPARSRKRTRGKSPVSPREGADPDAQRKKLPLAKKTLPDYAALSVYGLLKSSPRNCREAFYHQRQKLPRLRRQLDNNAFQEAETRLEQLTAAEAISAPNVSFLKEGELEAHLDLLTRHQAWPQEGFPQEFVEELLRKRLKDNIGQTQVVFDIAWPCPVAGSGDAPFDVRRPRLRDSALAVHQKVELTRRWLVNEFLAEHMRYDKAGASAVRSLADRIEKESDAALDFVRRHGPEQSRAILQDVLRFFSVLAATVQQAAVTSKQMENLCSFSDGEQQSAEARVVAKFLDRPWWAEQMKTLWRHASSEAVAGPRLQRVIELLSTTDADAAWDEAKANIDKWRHLRAEVVESAYQALADALLAEVASLTGAAELPAEARLQQTLERWEWLSGTPAVAKLPDADELRRQVVTAQARRKVAHGLDLLEQYMQADTSQTAAAEDMQCDTAHNAEDDIVKELVAAFDDVRGLRVEPEKVDIARDGVEWICNCTAASREIVQVGKALAAMLPAEVEASAGPELWKWQALTAHRARLNKSVTAHALVALSADGDVNLQRVPDMCEALTAWEAEAASVECVPPSLGEKAAENAVALRAALQTHAQTIVDAARVALEAALPKYEFVAQGRRQCKASWKDGLTSDSTWDQIVAEVNKYLLHSEDGHIKDRLKGPHDEVTQAQTAYAQAVQRAAALSPDDGFSVDAALEQRAQTVKEAGLVTTAEAYFVEVLITERIDKIPNKLRTRITSMVKKNVDPMNVFPAIWAKVQDYVG